MAKVTTHSARDGRVLRYLRCAECEPSCTPLGAVAEIDAYAALAEHERRVHGREPRRARMAGRKALDAFYASRRVDGRSQGTVDFYRGKLEALLAHLGSKPMRSWSALDLAGWIEAHPDWKPGQTRALLRAVRAFRSWALEAGIAVGDLAGRLTGPKVERRRRRIPTRAEVDRLLEAARTWPDARVKRWLEVAVALASEVGFAVGDIEAVEWSQVDWERNEISRPRKKSGNALAPKMTAQLVDALKRHLAARPAISGPIVRDLPGNGALQKTVRGLFRRAGVPRSRGDGLHLLRHGVVTRLLASGIKPHVVAELVGDSVETIMKHYAHATEADLAAAARALEA